MFGRENNSCIAFRVPLDSQHNLSGPLQPEEQPLKVTHSSKNWQRHAKFAAVSPNIASAFNPHYHFAIVPVADRSVCTPTGPQMRTMQMISTNHKRERAGS